MDFKWQVLNFSNRSDYFKFYHGIFLDSKLIAIFSLDEFMMSERSVQQKNLLVACARGEYDFLEKYIQKYPQKRKYEVFDNHKWGPLHHAVASNSYDCVQLLLSSGLVNTSEKSFEGQTCLFVAVVRGASQAIIKLLLKSDAKLFNEPNNENVYPIHKAVMQNAFETVRTMIETLNEMRIPFSDKLDWDLENSLFLAARAKNLQIIDYLLAHIKYDFQHENDSGLNAATVAMLPCEESIENEANNRLEIVKRLIPLTYDTSTSDCMQKMVLPISFACLFKHQEVFHWFMQQFYLSDLNEHRDLIQRALYSFEFVDFDYQMILIALHSKITKFKHDEQMKNITIYENLIANLHKIFKHNRGLFIEMVAVLRPKLDLYSLQHIVLKFMPNESIEGSQMLNDFVAMFHIMQMEDLLDISNLFFFIPSAKFINNVLLMFMPFSTKPSADVYLEGCRRYEDTNSNSQEENEALARFCIDGEFRIKCDLKSLCRAVIRSSILQTNCEVQTNHQRLNRIRSMLLPIPIKNFLLFNYTNYDFK